LYELGGKKEEEKEKEKKTSFPIKIWWENRQKTPFTISIIFFFATSNTPNTCPLFGTTLRWALISFTFFLLFSRDCTSLLLFFLNAYYTIHPCIFFISFAFTLSFFCKSVLSPIYIHMCVYKFFFENRLLFSHVI
jgi:hypothetical protein